MKPQTKKALIYVRVSDDKQRDKGSGLESQQHRCRQHAHALGLEVEEVFSDDISGGGDPRKRPGMSSLLTYLSKRKAGAYVVIFDDLKRFARDTRRHWELRDALSAINVEVASPNYKFDDSPEGEFVETVFAAQGQLERKQNRRQVVQKMKARFEQGYYTMYQPPGYRYAKDKSGGGKVLVRNEPDATIIAEALEGFASGRFQLQTDIVAFLETFPELSLNKNGKVQPQSVSSLLRRVMYAGMVERPEWGISRRQGKHEPLISYETYLKIQYRLDGRANVPDRKNRDEDFPLRGFVSCACCGHPYTGGWSKSRNGARHAYYNCYNKQCQMRGRTVRREELEGRFEELVRSLEPSEPLFILASDMFKDAWDQGAAHTQTRLRALRAERDRINTSIDKMLDAVTQVSSPAVIASFERKIGEMENQRLVVEERMAVSENPRASFDESVRTALAFLRTPWKLWSFGDYDHKRLLLKLAFTKRVEWVLKEGFRTAELALPFRALANFSSVGKGGGGRDWIRTSVAARREIYSLVDLTTLPPFQNQW